MKNTISVKQSGMLGDLVYSLSAAHQAHLINNKPIDFYIGFNEINTVPGHPSGKYCMSDNMYEYIKPLLLHQPWINSVNKHINEPIDYDFDAFRHIGLNLAASDLRMMHFPIYPQLNHKLDTQPIIHEKDLEYLKDKIVINLSPRYRNPSIDYSILEPLREYLVFVGHDEEYKMFNRNSIMNVKRVHVKDALHMANIIASCRLFIGNQSSTFSIAEQLKTPRLLEVFNRAPNVIPCGGLGYGFYTTENLKFYLSKLGLNV
jgi:hypothetical protein